MLSAREFDEENLAVAFLYNSHRLRDEVWVHGGVWREREYQ
jgi:hypothetical protein